MTLSSVQNRFKTKFSLLNGSTNCQSNLTSCTARRIAQCRLLGFFLSTVCCQFWISQFDIKLYSSKLSSETDVLLFVSASKPCSSGTRCKAIAHEPIWSIQTCQWHPGWYWFWKMIFPNCIWRTLQSQLSLDSSYEWFVRQWGNSGSK